MFCVCVCVCKACGRAIKKIYRVGKSADDAFKEEKKRTQLVDLRKKAKFQRVDTHTHAQKAALVTYAHLPAIRK